LHSRHFVASCIYGNLSVMSRSSDFWESIDNRLCRLLMVCTRGFTTYNTGVMGLVVYSITAFSRRIKVFNSVYKPHTNFGGQILVKNAAYTRANAVFKKNAYLVHTYTHTHRASVQCLRIVMLCIPAQQPYNNLLENISLYFVIELVFFQSSFFFFILRQTSCLHF
jgi:hypothetical protein